jgi:hypothetical protein
MKFSDDYIQKWTWSRGSMPHFYSYIHRWSESNRINKTSSLFVKVTRSLFHPTSFVEHECCLHGCAAIQYSRSLLMLWRNTLSPSSGLKSLLFALLTFTPKMEAVYFPEMLVNFYWITWCHISEYSIQYCSWSLTREPKIWHCTAYFTENAENWQGSSL